MAPPSIKVSGLSFKFPDGSTGLEDISLELPARSRTLLIGGKAESEVAMANTASDFTSSEWRR
jgi:CCR4-NOT complex subunit CAF16